MATTRTNEKNLQYHFVVRWDAATQEWAVDVDTLDAKFDAEVIYDEASNSWLSYRDAGELRAVFTEKEDELALILQKQNDLTN